ncbi:type 2 lantibiotic biosynthesis protein LanM [Saccharothrix ecbatanensis]|uniref:Type 2 lantibiotic biosynthesis protein LanM n=1 Tax=Saccharothrix ecbatanensis TaxID=1105145 RepID=A0A7W9HM11_9PSEU|nr:type 2 lanthipeptide synthetase LanM family protein [Saccharothrix ecbatanensis]MBB5804586.1 type 2 lantibiotic biosynthesis protein LanM [Saccharothrix ecbatanensis]
MFPSAVDRPPASWWLSGVREDTRKLVVPRGRPSWAAFVERATATAARADFPDADPGDGVDGTDGAMRAFASALQPLVQAAMAQDPRLDAEFGRALGHRLTRIAARTLVLELNLERIDERLTGDTPRERFADFVRHVDLPTLFGRYPVLARLLGQACLHAVDAHRELLDRFERDRPEIVRTLLDGRDPGPLARVETGRGDRHARGRSVAVLTFEDGRRVVYKPRPVALHQAFADLLTWYDGHTGLGLRVPRTVVRPDHGWLEFVEHTPCADVPAVGRFYHRLGALIALLYAIDGADMHYENLIAAGDEPVLVDVETLFHPAVGIPADPAVQALARSVHRTALLPQVLLGAHGALDIGGMGGDQGDRSAADGVAWLHPGTDRMRLVRRPAPMPPAHNRPVVDGREAEPADYQGPLLAGFRVGYDALCDHRADLLGRLTPFADLPVRFLARMTQLYATLLDESTHPDALRGAAARQDVLDLLWDDSADEALLHALVPYEMSDLWSGDVPMFTTRPGSRDLWTSTGERLPDLLPVSGLDGVTAKVAALGEVDKHDQQWLITAGLASRPRPVEHRTGQGVPVPLEAVVPDPQRLLVAACGVADEVLAHATAADGRVNWVGLELVDDRHWAVAAMGAGLSNGYTGVALFLAQLGKLTGAARYTEHARDALAPIPGLLAAFAEDTELAVAVGSGGFHGLGGICYALARLADLLDDAEIGGWLRAAVDIAATVEAIGEDPANLVEGWAGGLAAMLAVRAESGLPAAGKLARAYADRLVAASPGGDGFARGRAGVGWALLRYAKVGGDRYGVVGRANLRADHALRQRLLDVTEADHSWCSGLSGAVLAHTAHPEQPVDAYTLHLDRCMNALAVHEPLRDLSLCHGELGVIESLTVLAERGHGLASAMRNRRAGLVLGALDQYGARCGTPDGVPSAGLLTGLSGIGYGLLRLGFPEQVPSALLLGSKHDTYHEENAR